MRRPLYLIIYIVILATALAGCTTPGERSRMRAGLDSLNQRNRNDDPFTVQEADSFVRFFDKHGSPNDRLLAHYLLGRAHHEAGHAPEALQCYHDALDQADTTAADCDYAQLARVHGQMAAIFYQQGLYREQLRSTKISVHYAWKGNDTLLALRNYEQENLAYQNLNLNDSAIFVIEQVSQLFEKYGYSKQAAISLGPILQILVEKGDYTKAKEYIGRYKSLSGYFDDNDNIQKGREIFYYAIGILCLTEQKMDSAVYWFQKELHDAGDYNNQNAAAKGLAMVYEQRHLSDSVAKYLKYAYATNDSINRQKVTEIVGRMQAHYDYSLREKEAIREKEKADKERRQKNILATLCLLMIMTTAIWVHKAQIRRKEKQLEYQQTIEELARFQDEVMTSRSAIANYEMLLKEKQNELSRQELDITTINNLQEQVDELKLLVTGKENQIEKLQSELTKQQKEVNPTITDKEKTIFSSPLYQTLAKKQYKEKMDVKTIKECQVFAIENLPELNKLLMAKQFQLNNKDYIICLLFRLGFKSKEIGNMTGLSKGRISQICSKVLCNVFGVKDGGAKELIELLKKYS